MDNLSFHFIRQQDGECHGVPAKGFKGLHYFQVEDKRVYQKWFVVETIWGAGMLLSEIL